VQRGLFCIAVVIALALGGCVRASTGTGGGSVTQTGEAKRVVDAAVAYTVAIGERDAAAACALMTADAQAKAARAMGGAASCEAAHTQAFSVVKADNRSDPAEMIRRAEKKVSIDGDEADLTFTGVENQAPLVFRRVGGRWKLAQSLLHLKKGD
jgi:ketosteroid isomerase-like protein